MAHRNRWFPSYKHPFSYGIFHGELLNNQMVHTLLETFTVCELEHGPVEKVDLPIKK